jgi:hypothetical protein
VHGGRGHQLPIFYAPVYKTIKLHNTRGAKFILLSINGPDSKMWGQIQACNTFMLRKSCPIALLKGTWGKDVQVHILLTSVLYKGSCSVSSPDNLPAGNDPRYPLAKNLGEPQSRSVQFVEEINLLHFPGIESRFLGHPSRSLVTVPTATSISLVTVPTATGMSNSYVRAILTKSATIFDAEPQNKKKVAAYNRPTTKYHDTISNIVFCCI